MFLCRNCDETFYDVPGQICPYCLSILEVISEEELEARDKDLDSRLGRERGK